MKQRLLIAFIFFGSLYISYSIGHEVGLRKSQKATLEGAGKVYAYTIAYAAALSLKAEVGNHVLIKSGNKVAAEQFSLHRINITIGQIEAIDYKHTPFEAEINKYLFDAKEYVKNARHSAE